MIILARDSFFSFHCILFPSMRAGRQEQASGLYRRRHRLRAACRRRSGKCPMNGGSARGPTPTMPRRARSIGRRISAEIPSVTQTQRCFRRIAPMAARRARPVQRSGRQGLRGDRRGPPEARQRLLRTEKGTGRGCTPGFALPVQPAAAVAPRFGGCRGDSPPGPFFPTAFFGKKAVPRPGRPAPGAAAPPRSRRLNTAPARTGTGAVSTGAGRRPPAGPCPGRCGRRRPAPPPSGCGWRSGPSWPAR